MAAMTMRVIAQARRQAEMAGIRNGKHTDDKSVHERRERTTALEQQDMEWTK